MVAKFFENLTIRHKILMLVFLGVVLLAGLVATAFYNLSPILISMAEERARQLAVAALNQAISEVMDRKVSYSDLVTIVSDNQGRISMIQANTMLMNALASEAALEAQHNLEELEDQGVELPLGAALGIDLFSGSGPKFRVRVVPVGSVTTQFVTAFETAGINQTRHEITLEATTHMSIVIPRGPQPITVSVMVPVAESIIVGAVPEYYVNVPDTDSMLNMVP